MADLKEALAAKQTEEVKDTGYFGSFRILNGFATPIERVGDKYFPKDKDEEAILDYHVKMGNITFVK